MSSINTPSNRVQHANKLIRVIASRGRRHFFCSTTGRVAQLELDTRNRVWLVDECTGQQVYTHANGRWEGFTHGELLRRLVEHMRNYVIRGTLIPRATIAPVCRDENGNDLWDGDEACLLVQAAAFDLPIIARDKDNGPCYEGVCLQESLQPRRRR